MVKFDEQKLLYNQIDRIKEVFDRMNTMPQGKLISLDLKSPISIESEAEATDSFAVMTETEEIINKDLIREIEEGILLLDTNPEDIVLLEVPIAGRTVTIIEVTADSPEVTAHPDPLSGGPELYLHHPLGK